MTPRAALVQKTVYLLLCRMKPEPANLASYLQPMVGCSSTLLLKPVRWLTISVELASAPRAC